MRARTIFVTASLLLGGCAGGRVAPCPEFTRAADAVREAEGEGAAAERLAAMHLSLARGQLQSGARRMSRGDREAARWIFLRAEADAHMATLIVREAGLRDAARRTLDETNAPRRTRPREAAR